MRLLLALTLALSPLSEPAMLGEILHLLRGIEKRALSSPIAGSLGKLIQDVETRLGTPASGSVASQVGTDADAASATGSVHAKIKDLKANPATVINSIQRGTISITATSNTATITSVATGKATLLYGGLSADGSDARQNAARCELTNATTVTITRGSGVAGTSVGAYEVVEFK